MNDNLKGWGFHIKPDFNLFYTNLWSENWQKAEFDCPV